MPAEFDFGLGRIEAKRMIPADVAARFLPTDSLDVGAFIDNVPNVLWRSPAEQLIQVGGLVERPCSRVRWPRVANGGRGTGVPQSFWQAVFVAAGSVSWHLPLIP